MALGVIFLIAAFMEARLGWECRATPTRYSLKELEAGAQVSNRHAILEAHYAIRNRLVFSTTRLPPDGQARPDPEQYVEYMWYPVVSEPPQEGTVPEVFRVLVKEEAFAMKVRDRPSGVVRVDEIKGMFMDDWHTLRGEERMLLQHNFPKVDLSKVLLFEAGRKPPDFDKLLGFVFIGLLLIVVSIFYWKPDAKKSPQADSEDGPDNIPDAGPHRGTRPW
ncbi:hypothetical protein DES53_102120 [Roseimicrobium gellanilyticum]|uniref:Uncharacterized protein n=1 Tax=Roseimicrobium gellanilyticum TaxID=748857 RepID=A0A366HRN4_9BACT|nr:hypothetical protein [Roseimicrobium gellanilyticum]RBP45738.1 hypothetical protein DES53_102120 [Roseimicrobium gellanilyticum]